MCSFQLTKFLNSEENVFENVNYIGKAQKGKSCLYMQLVKMEVYSTLSLLI